MVCEEQFHKEDHLENQKISPKELDFHQLHSANYHQTYILSIQGVRSLLISSSGSTTVD